MKSILGKKIGMTQIFIQNGNVIPVTIIEVPHNVVTGIYTMDKDGYVGTQLSVFDKRDKLETKPVLGHLKKANTGAKRFTKEIRNMQGKELGEIIKLDIFSKGQLVDVIGVSKGKGFAGAIKRHNQKIGPKSHGGGGGSKPVRLTGSLGDISGNKVVKGMTMPGHLGHQRCTIQNLEIMDLDVENNFILVKGSIPGPRKGFVIIRDNIKLKPSRNISEVFKYQTNINKTVIDNNKGVK